MIHPPFRRLDYAESLVPCPLFRVVLLLLLNFPLVVPFPPEGFTESRIYIYIYIHTLSAPDRSLRRVKYTIDERKGWMLIIPISSGRRVWTRGWSEKWLPLLRALCPALWGALSVAMISYGYVIGKRYGRSLFNVSLCYRDFLINESARVIV